MSALDQLDVCPECGHSLADDHFLYGEDGLLTVDPYKATNLICTVCGCDAPAGLAEGERGALVASRSTPSEPSQEGDGAPILRPGEVLCGGDCTVACGRCKGQPYFTRRSMSGRFALVLWRESVYPAASFNRCDFNDADERASALTDELNAASAVTNGPDSDAPRLKCAPSGGDS